MCEKRYLKQNLTNKRRIEEAMIADHHQILEIVTEITPDVPHHPTIDTVHQRTIGMHLHQAATTDTHPENTTDTHLLHENTQQSMIVTENTETTHHENTPEAPIITAGMTEAHLDPTQAHTHHLLETAGTTMPHEVIHTQEVTNQAIPTQEQVVHQQQIMTDQNKKGRMVTSTAHTCRAAVHMVLQKQVPTALHDRHLTEVVRMARVQHLALHHHPLHTHQVPAID